MGALETAKDIAKLAVTATLSNEVIALLKEKALLLEQQVSVLTTENARFTTERADFVKKIEDLEQELKRLRPGQDRLEDGAEKFLQLLFVNEEMSIEEIAASLGISKGIAEYHRDVLFEKQMIHPTDLGFVSTGDDLDAPVRWGIIANGRAYLVKNKLVQ